MYLVFFFNARSRRAVKAAASSKPAWKVTHLETTMKTDEKKKKRIGSPKNHRGQGHGYGRTSAGTGIGSLAVIFAKSKITFDATKVVDFPPIGWWVRKSFNVLGYRFSRTGLGEYLRKPPENH